MMLEEEEERSGDFVDEHHHFVFAAHFGGMFWCAMSAIFESHVNQMKEHLRLKIILVKQWHLYDDNITEKLSENKMVK